MFRFSRPMASLTVAAAMMLSTGAAAATTMTAATAAPATSSPAVAASTPSTCPAHPLTTAASTAARAALQRQEKVAARAHSRATAAHARARLWHQRTVTARVRAHRAQAAARKASAATHRQAQRRAAAASRHARADGRKARNAARKARALAKAASLAAAKVRAMKAALGTPAGTSGLGSCVYVHGGSLVDGTGVTIHPVGATRAGSEYACVQGWGMFDGPTDDASIAAMTTWNVQIVRIPLNEDCWLGINGVNPQFAGANYQAAIEGYVSRLEAHGMIVDLDLHWTAPAAVSASTQDVMADTDHSTTFWSQVAAIYGQDHHVVFELFNEPHDISWACWENGCTVPATDTQAAWQAAGMQQLVTAVRSAGATNVVILGGLGFAGDISQWKAHQPTDPLGQEAAAWHIYNFGSCTDATCWASQAATVTGIPVVVTEIGETDCGSGFVDPLMSWLDKTGYSYLAWTWDDWAGCGGPSLLASYDGTPNGDYGAAVKAHFLSRPALPQ